MLDEEYKDLIRLFNGLEDMDSRSQLYHLEIVARKILIITTDQEMRAVMTERQRLRFEELSEVVWNWIYDLRNSY